MFRIVTAIGEIIAAKATAMLMHMERVDKLINIIPFSDDYITEEEEWTTENDQKGDENMGDEKKSSPEQEGSRTNERDRFFEFWGISEEEERFFKVLYRRRQIYRLIILILIGVIALLLGLR